MIRFFFQMFRRFRKTSNILTKSLYEYKKWSIWRANLDPVVGSEQGKSRPVIIIRENDINELLNAVNIIPITSRKPAREVYPNEVLISASKTGLDVESIALCHQIRTIDKKRLSKLLAI